MHCEYTHHMYKVYTKCLRNIRTTTTIILAACALDVKLINSVRASFREDFTAF